MCRSPVARLTRCVVQGRSLGPGAHGCSGVLNEASVGVIATTPRVCQGDPAADGGIRRPIAVASAHDRPRRPAAWPVPAVGCPLSVRLITVRAMAEPQSRNDIPAWVLRVT